MPRYVAGNAVLPPEVLRPRDTGRIFPPGKHTSPPAEWNRYDACLLYEMAMYNEYVADGNLNGVCCPRGRLRYEHEPWVSMPASGRQFNRIGTLPISSIPKVAGLFTGADTLVLSYQVPLGYDGVITDIICGVFSNGGTGFVEGSGDLSWRFAANQRFLHDLGNLQVSIGSFTDAAPIPRGGLFVYSGNLISVFVAAAPGSESRIGPAGNIICSIEGWFWSR